MMVRVVAETKTLSALVDKLASVAA